MLTSGFEALVPAISGELTLTTHIVTSSLYRSCDDRSPDIELETQTKAALQLGRSVATIWSPTLSPKLLPRGYVTDRSLLAVMQTGARRKFSTDNVRFWVKASFA